VKPVGSGWERAAVAAGVDDPGYRGVGCRTLGAAARARDRVGGNAVHLGSWDVGRLARAERLRVDAIALNRVEGGAVVETVGGDPGYRSEAGVG
jgi:hypothetical protein